MNSINKISSGLFWSYAERLLAQLVNIIVSIVLARIIAPDEFGAIAIVNIFINIANAFVINGFGNALIQKKDADEIDFSSMFYFSISFSIAIYIVILITSKYISSFYNMPILNPVIKIMGIRIPVAAINSIQQAFVSKRMEFKKFFFATLIGTIISAFIGITMAYAGFGIWSLAFQYLTNVFIDTTVLWFTAGWKPKLIYSHARVKVLFSFGWKIMMVGVMTTIYANLRNLIIGKKYTSAELAYSEKGEQFPNAIAGNINTAVNKVLFPVFSEYQDDTLKLKRMVRRSIKIGCYVLFPILLGFATVAKQFVTVFLTYKWIRCVPYLQIMCVIYVMQPLQISSLQCIKALGKGNLYLLIDIIKKVVGLMILLLTVFMFHNVFAILIGTLITELICVFILFPINKRLLEYKYTEQLIDIVVNAITSIIMCIGVLFFSLINPFSGFVHMLIDVIVGAIIYIVISTISKNESYMYILNILKRRC